MSYFAFSLRNLWYFRNVAPVIEHLAKRGHKLDLIVGKYERGTSGSQEELDRFLESYPNLRLVKLKGLLKGKHRKATRKHLWDDLDMALSLAVDHFHFRASVFDEKEILRQRSKAKAEGPLLALIDRPIFRREGARRLGMRALRRICEALPPDWELMDLWLEEAPDLLVVCPLIDVARPQFDQVRAASRLGMRTALFVHSWDNLSSKSWLRRPSDAILVWNDMQRREVTDFHGLSSNNVRVCGAPHYDEWFDRTPKLSREDFHRELGLEPKEKTIVFVGSAVFQPPLTNYYENDFLAPWLEALRSSNLPNVARANIILRPHPKRPGELQKLDLSAFDRVRIWPPEAQNPVSLDSRWTYFHSLYHSDAVVGLNTSAFLEAAILKRPVFTVLDPRFTASQRGTFHLDWLLRETDHPGIVRVAHTYDEHVAALERCLSGAEPFSEEEQRFIVDFIRPNGAEHSATDAACRALEDTARMPRLRVRGPHVWERQILSRLVLKPLADMDLAKRRSVSAKLKKDEERLRPRDQEGASGA